VSVPPLCVVSTCLRTPGDAEAVMRCLVSLWAHAKPADVLVVDDGTPDPELLRGLRAVVAELGFELVERGRNDGHSAAVNVGLRRARDEGRDAILVDADVELLAPGCLERMLARTDTEGRPAAVVGARLLTADGTIQSAGRFLSLLDRRWWDRFAHAPAELPEALAPCRCTVSGALQLIRHEALVAVGLYDERLRVAVEDVDYCLRVFASGRECIYESGAVALHLARTGLFNHELDPWTDEAYRLLGETWATADLRHHVQAPL
jgi:O-antigen biosynthesis protein